MRFRHRDGSVVHLAYCSNVHPAEDVDGVVGQLHRFAAPVRRTVGAVRLGVGLWLPAGAAAGLAADDAGLARLRDELGHLALEVVTLNGFPYQGFHDPVVKHAVYRPDWCDPARAAYTLDLARILAALLPADAAGGTISTLPLGWREPWTADHAAGARKALEAVARGLDSLQADTGRDIRLGLEPEPGCVLETTAQAAAFLEGLGDRIGVCLDACHLAVGFEEPLDALRRLEEAGVPVVKAQVSAALRGPAADVAAFDEPRFLHQARARRNGRVLRADDLGDALAGGLPADEEWRVHFHAPVHFAEGTTQPELEALLAALMGGPEPATRHLEVETYTWSVLPERNRPTDEAGLARGLAAEITWTGDRLAALGLVPLDCLPPGLIAR